VLQSILYQGMVSTLLKVEGILVSESLQKASQLLEAEKGLPASVKAIITMLVLIVQLLMDRLGINSTNSSIPPSQDENRKRGSKKACSAKKRGGQAGHTGNRLNRISDPDVITYLEVDKSCLQPEHFYMNIGYEVRQVFDIEIKRHVTEYRAEILQDETGRKIVAAFPDHVTTDVQYGSQVKAHAVYMSQYQLLPYDRIQEYFASQMHLPLSVGSIFNFNQLAYTLLEEFENITKCRLIAAALIHADETGINIDKKRCWLHVASNGLWTHFYPHQKRGVQATNEIGILPLFSGILCHDHWKPYYKFTTCLHSLCNAHHIRELTYALEQDNQQWAKLLIEILIKIKSDVDEKEAAMLTQEKAQEYLQEYLAILEKGKEECPLASALENPRRGRVKQSKSRNLLNRLLEYHEDVLRFMTNPIVPFTNNQSENDLRMTKVQQKISGCFRSHEGALIFCRIRGYLSTCRKHGVNVAEALKILFEGKLPEFAYES
jgi:transposase